jgi:hypothetical protein
MRRQYLRQLSWSQSGPKRTTGVIARATRLTRSGSRAWLKSQIACMSKKARLG